MLALRATPLRMLLSVLPSARAQASNAGKTDVRFVIDGASLTHKKAPLVSPNVQIGLMRG
jgi:hypothetical protein